MPNDDVKEILEILKRIEERQIKTTAMVEHVEEAKTPIVGSFGTAEIPGDEKEEQKKGEK